VRSGTCVLVHGAWHGPWCWERVLPQLQDAGFATVAAELSHELTSFAGLCERLSAYLETIEGPVVLVGHSRGAALIDEVAKHSSCQIAGLIYLSGVLLAPRQSVLRVLRAEGSSPLLQHAQLEAQRQYWTVTEDLRASLFYNACSTATIEMALPRWVPEPTDFLLSAARASTSQFDRMPKVYVECHQDRVLPLSLQRVMQSSRLGMQRRILDGADHAAFFSAPAALASILNQEAAQLFAAARMPQLA
jgi:pimeloyl-ACP methyl ester carboxylesterase